jgi:hypothetical protein
VSRRARSRSRPNTIQGQFRYHTIDFVASPVWRALSLSERKILDRIDLELASHGGRDNGDLIITRRDFADFGVSPKAQLRGIAGLVALGPIKWMPGHASPDPAHGRAARFGILYRSTLNGPSEEQWRRFKTIDEVKATLTRARAKVEARNRAQRAKKTDAIVVPFGNHLPVGSKGNH